MKDSYFYWSFRPAFICSLLGLLFWGLWSLSGEAIPNYGTIHVLRLWCFDFGQQFPVAYRLIDVVFPFLPFMIIGKTADVCFEALKKQGDGTGVFFGARSGLILGVIIFLLFFFTFLVVYSGSEFSYFGRVVGHAAIVMTIVLFILAILFSFAADFSHGIGFILSADMLTTFAVALSGGFLMSAVVSVCFFIVLYSLILLWRIKTIYRVHMCHWMPN